MGVQGLWSLLEPSGKPVTLESLENKVLAVDVSIWLHQVVKGFQDAQGNPLPNAHLLGLFHRICKLLFYKIRPVFVFDGGVPNLKKQTVEQRQQKKTKAVSDADRVREKLISNLIKHKAINTILGNNLESTAGAVQPRPVEDDMFVLPPAAKTSDATETRDESSSTDDDYLSNKYLPKDLHSIDVKSEHFKSLPADVRHDILTELKETRKQSSWGRLHEIPKASDDFSSYQMERLLKRRSVQVSLEEAEKEMGGHTLSLREMEEMLRECGVETCFDMGKRIASDNVTRYIYITEKGKNEKPQNKVDGNAAKDVEPCKKEPAVELAHDSKEEESEIINLIEEGDFESDWSSDMNDERVSESEDCEDKSFKLAKNFIFENSGLSQKQILKLIKQQRKLAKSSEKNISTNRPSTSGINLKSTAVKEEIEPISPSPSESEQKLPSDSDLQTLDTQETNITKFQENCLERSIDNSNCINEKSSSTSVDKEKLEINTLSEVSGKPNELSATHDAGSVLKSPVNISEDFGHVSNDESHSGNLEIKGDHSVTNSVDSIKQPPLENTAEIVQVSTSDSDEDFVDVEQPEVPSPALKGNFTSSHVNGLEIMVSKSCFDVKDDIFADVFSEVSPKHFDSAVKDIPSMEVVSESKQTTNTSISDSTKEVTVVSENTVKDPEETTHVSSSNSNKQMTPTVEDSPSDSCSVVKESQEDATSSMETGMVPEPINKNKEPVIKISSEELHQMKDSLVVEQNVLISEKGRQDRLAASISEQMTLEAQELIQLFGLPYILAPMEAEAQCAFLDAISLTEGTITDDSDIWLFGGQQVYKNFFNQKKHVQKYEAIDIHQYFKLTRHQLIALALLVGSDYTTGLHGVGPVTALEIVSSFPCGKDNSVSSIAEGLQKFRDWWVTGRAMGRSRSALRNKLKNLRLSEGFPNMAVIEAYFHPQVDESRDTFTWGSPDLASLRSYTLEKFGWDQRKTDQILLPVIKKLNERNMQKSLDSYFKVKPIFNPSQGKLSKRVQKAIGHIDRSDSSDNEVVEPKPKRKRKPKQPVNNPDDNNDEVKDVQLPETSRGGKRPRRGRPTPDKPGITRDTLPVNQSGEFILQREKDKLNALKNKLKAIEVYRTSRRGLDRTARDKRKKRKELNEAKLSESSSD